MQQNYPVAGNYGTSFTTSVSSGYGTENPGPQNIEGFMGAVPHGEMMGTASDGSSLAAYAPIVHAMPTRLFCANHKQFIPEGTLLRIYSVGDSNSSKTAHADCTMGDEYVLIGHESGVKDDSATWSVSGLDESLKTGRSPFYRPTASGSHGSKSAEETDYVDTVSLALQSVTRIRLEKVKPQSETWAAGTCIYVRDDQTNITLTSSKAGSKTCLGVTTLPCNPEHEEWVYLCLRPDLRATD